MSRSKGFGIHYSWIQNLWLQNIRILVSCIECLAAIYIGIQKSRIQCRFTEYIGIQKSWIHYFRTLYSRLHFNSFCFDGKAVR